MSLLTDALRLREGRRPGRGESGPSFPPFRGPRPGRWVAGMLGICVLGVLGWWQGGWVLERIEGLAGMAPIRSTPNPPEQADGATEVPPARNTLADPPSGAAKAAVREEMSPHSKSSGPIPAGVAVADSLFSAEGKKRGEVLLTDSRVKAAAEKAGPAENPQIPEGETPAAALPAEGLQPMKVDLQVADLLVLSPLEQEKKRIEAVEEFLRALKVQGVRLQGTDSRILVDGVPIGLGEKVGALGLVLESVEPQKIIFSDATGKKFPKSY